MRFLRGKIMTFPEASLGRKIFPTEQHTSVQKEETLVGCVRGNRVQGWEKRSWQSPQLQNVEIDPASIRRSADEEMRKLLHLPLGDKSRWGPVDRNSHDHLSPCLHRSVVNWTPPTPAPYFTLRKRPPANIQLFQVSIPLMWLLSGALQLPWWLRR